MRAGPACVNGSTVILSSGARQVRSAGAVLALLLLPLLLLASSAAWSQTFPALTGRVVDAANLLKAEERAALEAKLKA